MFVTMKIVSHPLLSKEALAEISQRTLRHYETEADSFWAGTKDHDVSQNYQALLQALPPNRALSILDFGCGPGRDLHYFRGVGHEAVGLDGCPVFCEMARRYSRCEVWQQDFLTLDLPAQRFDGVFANASLFHVPRQELVRVLRQLRDTLKQDGVLFSSSPRGGAEGWSGERYGTYLEWDDYRPILEAASLKPLNHYYRPAGLPLSDQPWLATVSRRV